MSSFWVNEPVPQNKVEKVGQIKQLTATDHPIDLPKNFEWLEITSDDAIQTVHQFLVNNYVQSDTYRLQYSEAFLRWYFDFPDGFPDCKVGLVSNDGGEMLGFISANPAPLSIGSTKITTMEVNFLCVHRDNREAGLAPLLIKEITRRVVHNGCQLAMFTGKRPSYDPLCVTHYYHRMLNIPKLVALEYCSRDHLNDIGLREDMFKVIHHSNNPLKMMGFEHLSVVHKLLNKKLNDFHFAPIISKAEVEHFLRCPDAMMFVAEDGSGKVVDFISGIKVPMYNIKLKKFVETISLYYYTDHSYPSVLMFQWFVEKMDGNTDVINLTDVMGNEAIIRSSPCIMPGSGKMGYYLYNWADHPFSPQENAKLVL